MNEAVRKVLIEYNAGLLPLVCCFRLLLGFLMIAIGERAYHMDCFIYGKWDSSQRTFVFLKINTNISPLPRYVIRSQSGRVRLRTPETMPMAAKRDRMELPP